MEVGAALLNSIYNNWHVLVNPSHKNPGALCITSLNPRHSKGIALEIRSAWNHVSYWRRGSAGSPADPVARQPILIKPKELEMTIQFNEENGGKLLVVHASGTLVKADYAQFVPEVERLIRQHGKLRLLFEMSDFHGWDVSAAWEDFKFGVEHFSDIERLAMVGEKQWQHGMAALCKPFMQAAIRYFDHTEAAEARQWLDEPEAPS
jgi:hypothetical protein